MNYVYMDLQTFIGAVVVKILACKVRGPDFSLGLAATISDIGYELLLGHNMTD